LLATFRRKNGFLKFATAAARHKTSRLLTSGSSRSVVAGFPGSVSLGRVVHVIAIRAISAVPILEKNLAATRLL
jgi:hypothetical protein